MAKSKIAVWKKVALTGAAAATLGLGFWASQAFYTVKQVVDGDTFVTAENRIVRLDSVNAPEIQYCLGKKAKDEFSKLILNKKVFLKVSYVDGYNRLIASVFTLQGNVGESLVAKGLATFKDKGTLGGSTLAKTAKEAKEAGIGIFSSLCTQMENPDNPKCNIKGNNKNGNKIFHYPGCKSYTNTVVQLYLGDRWFCTTKQALSDGYSKGADCP